MALLLRTRQLNEAAIFVINNTIIHCTTMPGALLIENARRTCAADAIPSSLQFLSVYIQH